MKEIHLETTKIICRYFLGLVVFVLLWHLISIGINGKLIMVFAGGVGTVLGSIFGWVVLKRPIDK